MVGSGVSTAFDESVNLKKELVHLCVKEQLFFSGPATMLCDVQDGIDLKYFIASEGETYHGLPALLIHNDYKTPPSL